MKRNAIVVLVLASQVWGMASWGDSLFSTKVAARGTHASELRVRFAVGDIITVLVRENTDASTDSLLDTEKKSSISAVAPPGANTMFTDLGFGLLDPAELPNWNIKVQNKHESDGESSRTNTVAATVSCVVRKVFVNGNVQIEGQKTVTVNREDTILHVSGIARQRDVDSSNHIDSGQLANAKVHLAGHGPLWNNQRRGWFTKLIDWIAPF